MDDTVALKTTDLPPKSSRGTGPARRIRRLVVTADDYGISPLTSRGILRLAKRGRVTCAVLLVNSPHAEEAVEAWRVADKPMELGWHPCLTLDRPISDSNAVRSLVNADGRFHPLGDFAKRLATGRIDRGEVFREFEAQYARYVELTNARPSLVNGHHHIHTFPVISRALMDVLTQTSARPYMRRVREPFATVAGIRGAEMKRLLLSTLGIVSARRLGRLGFPGNHWLAGSAENHSVDDPEFFTRWLARIPGRDVELMCHPGEYDITLDGRDGTVADGGLARRAKELRLLEDDSFPEACARAGFTLTAPSMLFATPHMRGEDRHAA